MITVLSIFGCVVTMTSNLLLACGKLKPVYLLGIVNGACFVSLNTMLALRGDGAIALLAVPSAWGMVTCAMGLWRLRRFRVLSQVKASDRPIELEG